MKNQFRNLDEDEIEFLDSVLESTRAKEVAIKRETAQQLDLFRRQQEEADKALFNQGGDADDANNSSTAGNIPSDESQWATNGRKRKRGKEKEVLKGVKLRKSSTNGVPLALAVKPLGIAPASVKNNNDVEDKSDPTTTVSLVEVKAKPPPDAGDEAATKLPVEENKLAKSHLGLGGYSSDED